MRLPIFTFVTAAILNLGSSALGMSSRPDGYTLVLVPDQYGTVQITHDLSELYPVVMASYEHPGDAAQLNIHVFQDNKWLPIAGPSFQSGTFLRVKPNRTIVVGSDNPVTAALLNSAGAWNSQQVLNIPYNNGTDLINWYGKYFNFTKGDFRWFADKYKLNLQDQTEGKSQPSWYDQPYSDDSREGLFRDDPVSTPVPAATPPRATPSAQPRSAGFQAVTTMPGAPVEAPPSLKPKTVALPTLTPKPAALAPAVPKPVAVPAVAAPAEATRAFEDAAAPTTPLVNEPGTPAFKGWKTSGPSAPDAAAPK